MSDRKNILLRIPALVLLAFCILSFVALASFIHPKYKGAGAGNDCLPSDQGSQERIKLEDSSQIDGELEKSRIISISPEGKKEFTTLEEAVDSSEEGSTIFLGPEEYLLEKPMEILKPIRLVGSSSGGTYILCSGGEYVVNYSGDGLFSAENITFQHEGNDAADVMVIDSGEINLYQCVFFGGVWDDQQKIGGGGLILAGRSGSIHGIIQECTSEYNGLFGIDVFNRSYVDLVENICRYNGASGIGFSHESSVAVYRNQCIENGYHGIELQGDACPALIGNVCSNNSECGIAYFNQSNGVAYHNECSGNKWGIYIDGTAHPVLFENIFEMNTNDIEDKRS